MYLPNELPNCRVLITVKTYPQPSSKYDELVCTAGLLEDGKWIRIYPVPFRALPYGRQYEKYSWLELDLIRKSSDFRPESYKPRLGGEGIKPAQEKISTAQNWARRKSYVFKEVFDSMSDLISLAKSAEKKSLATLKPTEITKFTIEPVDREWKPEWREKLNQLSLFDLDDKGQGKQREVVRKLPYKYSYEFLSKGDKKPRKLMIEDWEIGALYWNCLRQAEGDEEKANQLVRQKYFNEFVNKHDLHLFLGTTLQFHAKNAPNPFVIIGTFHPLKSGPYEQLPLL